MKTEEKVRSVKKKLENTISKLEIVLMPLCKVGPFLPILSVVFSLMVGIISHLPNWYRITLVGTKSAISVYLAT